MKLTILSIKPQVKILDEEGQYPYLVKFKRTLFGFIPYKFEGVMIMHSKEREQLKIGETYDFIENGN